MIEKITIKNFKSFKDVSLKLGPMNLFIGANASGKSNFFDALRVLQGIGYGFTLREILDGKPKSATSEVWEGIRGGSAKTAFACDRTDQPTLFRVGDDNFEITFSAVEGQLCNERLQGIYDSFPVDNRYTGPLLRARYYGPDPGHPSYLTFERNRPILAQMACVGSTRWSRTRSEMSESVTQNLSRDLVGVHGLKVRMIADTIANGLADMQRIDPSPSLLRGYSQAHKIDRMGERGENFAALIQRICSDVEAKDAYLSWLRELRPRDVDDVGVLKGALGEPMVMMKEKGREWPAPVLSDGTLRFAALAAAFFQPDMPGIITLEEIENGIHASRLRLLVELLRSRAAAEKTQVMATTHSPVVLAWLKPEEYATTFYCHRDEETGESRIIPLTEIPRFNEIVAKQPISDLFAEGWLEEAL